MITTKLYLYDSTKETNNYRGTEYSKYMLLGDTEIDNLDDTLDTFEVSLMGLPFSEEFAPKTKFILEKYETIETITSFHLVVSTDAVEKPILSDDNYFNHRITFIEASIDAQNRLVDNISVTYKLQDISLTTTAGLSETDTITVNKISVQDPTAENYGFFSSGMLFMTKIRRIGHHFQWVMPDWYNVDLGNGQVTPSWSDWNNFLVNQKIPAQGTKTIKLPTPMLECLSSKQNTKDFAHNGYCSIDVIITEKNTREPNIPVTTIYSKTINPAQDTQQESWTADSMYPVITGYGWIENAPIGEFSDIAGSIIPGVITYTQLSKVATTSPTKTDRVIEFTIRTGYTYNIIVKRHEFLANDVDIKEAGNVPFVYGYASMPNYYAFMEAKTLSFKNSSNAINANYPVIKTTFFGIDDTEIFMQSAPPANAYDLFVKAQFTTNNIFKNVGTSIDDTLTAFYLEPNDKQELQNTTIVENFYNQKNLWQIFLDIGKYIHARPKIYFGANNRYVVRWKRYGITTESVSTSTPISIYNSRFVEEYICACSSYVSNMVQLGGYVTETLAPKSSSEDFLVYNDVAQIITQKNIIEIINLDVIRKSDGAVRNLTGNGVHGESTNGYVFEKNIYNLLPIDKNATINKGLAIYYELGTNKIVGLNYRLPTVNTGEVYNDYAIKLILGTVFGYPQNDWKNIKVNDFLFKIQYRTKATLRSNQTRPDLRKYLLTTPYDKVPLHNQFNNQQDTVVDSVKFGNNTYGKLIRTGNTVYSTVEWVTDLINLKHSGELYRIRDNLYYVSKAKHTYYQDHIISEIEFSKDFNRLSQIIGIPSEPRFYEISEQSLITREITFDDYLYLSTTLSEGPFSLTIPTFITTEGFRYIRRLLFFDETEFPKYVATGFKNDIARITAVGNNTFNVITCHPLSASSSENTLTFEWDMVDNFSAGDQVKEVPNVTQPTDSNKAYNALLPYRYGDIYGRCDMVDFAIFEDLQLTNEQVMNLPESPEIPFSVVQLMGSQKYQGYIGTNKSGLIILKDNREKLNFNYNLQMLSDSDRFVISSYVWQPNKKTIKLALLTEEVNKISNNTIPNSIFKENNIPFGVFPVTDGREQYGLRVNIPEALSDKDLTGVKAIAIYSEREINDSVNSGAKYFVMARNITGLTAAEAKTSWCIRTITKDIFKQQ